jgi:phosphate-selective porin OprO/OprP
VPIALAVVMSLLPPGHATPPGNDAKSPVQIGFEEESEQPASLDEKASSKEEKPAAVSEPAQASSLHEDPKRSNWTIDVIGRMEIDATLVNQTARDKAIIGDIENATGFRRARLGAEGKAGDAIHWQAEFDFAGGDIVFRNVLVAIQKVPVLREVRIGHFREPFSLEGQTSSNYFDFTERSPANALDPARNWGIGFITCNDSERVTFAGGAFRSGSNRAGDDFGDDNDMAYTFRLTGLPWFADEQRYMHVGAAFSQQFPPNDVVTFNQGARNSLLQPDDNPLVPFIPNIAIPANQLQRYNVQWATVIGSLSFQAEWNAAYIDQIGGGPVLLHGGYVSGTWFLTGEHRNYMTRYGTFGMTRVLRPVFAFSGDDDRPHGCGAWELVCRLAYLDFDSPNIPRAPTGLLVGNRLTTATFGVNWLLNDRMRFLADYVHAVPVDPNFGPSGADAFFLRCAVFW